jgi:protein TonB
MLQATEAMIEQKQEVSSRASLAADTAPEQAGKPEDAASVAPDEGSAIEAKRKIEAWQRKIFAHIVRHKRYPGEARAKALAGETLIAFTLDRQGHVANLRIARSSGHAVLDRAAIQVLERADPLPVPPVQLASQNLDFSVPMRFSAK